VIVAGKEFPNTPEGWWAAADHVRSLGPTFYRDADDFAEEGWRMQSEMRIRNIASVVGLAVCAVAFIAVWLRG
jgi:hypothetical protein